MDYFFAFLCSYLENSHLLLISDFTHQRQEPGLPPIAPSRMLLEIRALPLMLLVRVLFYATSVTLAQCCTQRFFANSKYKTTGKVVLPFKIDSTAVKTLLWNTPFWNKTVSLYLKTQQEVVLSCQTKALHTTLPLLQLLQYIWLKRLLINLTKQPLLKILHVNWKLRNIQCLCNFIKYEYLFQMYYNNCVSTTTTC